MPVEKDFNFGMAIQCDLNVDFVLFIQAILIGCCANYKRETRTAVLWCRVPVENDVLFCRFFLLLSRVTYRKRETFSLFVLRSNSTSK